MQPKSHNVASLFQMQFEIQQQQLRSQTVSLKEEQEDQQLVQVSDIYQNFLHLSKHKRCCCKMLFLTLFLMFSWLLLQLQQLQQHLESSKEEVNQLKSDLEENVELVGFIFCS